MVRGWSVVRLACALAASVLVVTGCGGGSGVPGPPSAYLGTVVNKPVPDSDRGSAAHHGRGPDDQPGRPAGPGRGACRFPDPVPGDLPADDGKPAGGWTGRSPRPGWRAGCASWSSPSTRTGTRLPVARLPDAGRGASELVPAHRQPGRDRNRIWRYFGVWYSRSRRQPARYGLADGQVADLRHRPPRRPDLPGRERGGSASWSWARPNATGAPVDPSRCAGSSAPRAAPTSAHPDASTWTAAEALSPIAWLTGQPIRPPPAEAQACTRCRRPAACCAA